MLPTAEVRWFVVGSLPSEVVAWFWQGVTPSDPDSRDDRYLVLPGCDAVGVKLRLGTLLDVKARIGEGVVVAYPAGIDGVLERWVKWSCDEPQVIAGLGRVSADLQEWVTVHKARFLRGVPLDDTDAVDGERGGRSLGCHVELTRVRAGDGLHSEAWTLGFEAYGARESLDEAVGTAVMRFFSERPPLPLRLTRTTSMGYPAWLSRLEALRSGQSTA